MLKRFFWGYHPKSVDGYIRKYMEYSRQEILQLEDQIRAARQQLETLQQASSASQNSEISTTSNEPDPSLESETAAALESQQAYFQNMEPYLATETSFFDTEQVPYEATAADAEKVEEMESIEATEAIEEMESIELIKSIEPMESIEADGEVKAVEDGVEHTEPAEATESAESADVPTKTEKTTLRSGKVLMFKRRTDPPQLREEGTQLAENQQEGTGYWNSIDHFLHVSMPEELEELDADSLVVAAAAEQQEQITGTGRSQGFFPYFNYSLPVTSPNKTNHLQRKQSPPTKLEIAARKPNREPQPQTSKEQDIAPQNSPQAQGSAQISKEVRQLRYQYITGKHAGEDIKDNDKLIVKKGELITNEIVDQADQAGKLAELIVHMYIPELGEDV